MGRAIQRTFAGFEVELEPENTVKPAISGPIEALPGQRSGMVSGPQVLEPADLEGKTVYVVDSHSLIYQVFHAMSDLSTPDGRPANAIYGFVRDILDIITKRSPDLLFCAFDYSSKTFRNDLFPEYKANRDPMPDDLRSQIPEIQRMLRALSIPILVLENYEADDIMATLADQVDRQGGNCVVVTSDKDCRQLITPRVCLLNLRKNLFYRAEHLKKDWGIRPDQVVDFQSLVGDAVDNVPGVPTIGPKTASQLLGEFETLEAILSRTDEIKGKKAERIRESTEKARLSRKLVELDRKTPIEINWTDGCIGGVQVNQALELCREFGFRSLSNRVADLSPLAEPAVWEANYQTIRTVADLSDLVLRLSALPRFSLDTETTSLNPRWAEIVGYSFGWEDGQAAYVPVRGPAGESHVTPEQAIDLLRPLLENEAIEKIGQNLKYDMVVLRTAGIELKGPLFDTMVADYLLEPGRSSHGLDELAMRYFNHQTVKIHELIGKGKNQCRMDEVAIDTVSWYACEDADIPWRLFEILKARLVERDLDELFRNLEMPLIDVLTEMEFNGIAVETESLDSLSHELGQQLVDLKSEIHGLSKTEFNIDSPTQLAEVLFDRLGLPSIKKTRTGRSTDVEVLRQLAELHDLPERVIQYRQFAKLKNTYTDVLVNLVHPETRRVHTSFMQDVARTGRLSSKDPNLQNIPVRTETGRRIRKAFVPGEPGWKLIAADYSQIELRVLAHFSKDEALCKAFEQDRDIHTSVAAKVNGVPDDQVTSEMRRKAKAVNFGIIYGQSPYGLAREIGVSKDEAAAFIDGYFEEYPRVEQFINTILKNASRNSYVKTILKRQRPIEGVRKPDSDSDSSRSRTSAERIAVNTVIQGSAADLIKLAMINVHQRLLKSSLQTNLLLQIHDELVLECHPEDVSAVSELISHEMSNAFRLEVPLKVDLLVGDHWS